MIFNKIFDQKLFDLLHSGQIKEVTELLNGKTIPDIKRLRPIEQSMLTRYGHGTTNHKELLIYGVSQSKTLEQMKELHDAGAIIDKDKLNLLLLDYITLADLKKVQDIYVNFKEQISLGHKSLLSFSDITDSSKKDVLLYLLDMTPLDTKIDYIKELVKLNNTDLLQVVVNKINHDNFSNIISDLLINQNKIALLEIANKYNVTLSLDDKSLKSLLAESIEDIQKIKVLLNGITINTDKLSEENKYLLYILKDNKSEIQKVVESGLDISKKFQLMIGTSSRSKEYTSLDLAIKLNSSGETIKYLVESGAILLQISDFLKNVENVRLERNTKLEMLVASTVSKDRRSFNISEIKDYLTKYNLTSDYITEIVNYSRDNNRKELVRELLSSIPKMRMYDRSTTLDELNRLNGISEVQKKKTDTDNSPLTADEVLKLGEISKKLTESRATTELDQIKDMIGLCLLDKGYVDRGDYTNIVKAYDLYLEIETKRPQSTYDGVNFSTLPMNYF